MDAVPAEAGNEEEQDQDYCAPADAYCLVHHLFLFSFVDGCLAFRVRLTIAVREVIDITRCLLLADSAIVSDLETYVADQADIAVKAI